MKIIKYILLVQLLFFGGGSCGKLKFVAFKGPHFGFAGVKLRSPKLFGLKHHGLGFGHGFGGFGGGGGFHNSGYEHHEYHESYHSGGSFGSSGWLGK